MTQTACENSPGSKDTRERTARPGCRDWTTCTAWVRPHCWEEHVVAPETVPGPGIGGGASHWLLSGRILVAAQPTASSMETARPFSRKVPLAVHCFLPVDWPERRMCYKIQELRAWGPSHREGWRWAMKCPDGRRAISR